MNEENLFSRGRYRVSKAGGLTFCIYSLNHGRLMGMYPGFERHEEISVNSFKSTNSEHYETMTVAKDDYKIIHKYICFYRGNWFKRFFGINIGYPPKMLSAKEYDRALELSRNIIVESYGDFERSPRRENCICSTNICSNVRIVERVGIEKDTNKKTGVEGVYASVMSHAIMFSIGVSAIFVCFWIAASCYFSVQAKRASVVEKHAHTQGIHNTRR